MRPEITTIVLSVLAIAFAIVVYMKDPGLPWPGARKGLSILWFVLPRLVPALVLAGMLQVLVPQKVVARHLGREGGVRAIVIASVAGVPSLAFPVVAGWLVKTYDHE